MRSAGRVSQSWEVYAAHASVRDLLESVWWAEVERCAAARKTTYCVGVSWRLRSAPVSQSALWIFLFDFNTAGSFPKVAEFGDELARPQRRGERRTCRRAASFRMAAGGKPPRPRRAARPEQGAAGYLSSSLLPALLLLVVAAAGLAWRRLSDQAMQRVSDNDGTYVGGLKSGLREGHGTMEWRNGNVYVGEWQRGGMTGQGKLRFADGAAYEGTLQAGLPQGRGSYAFANGNTFDGAWENGEKSGTGTFRYADGRAQVGTWLADKPTDGAAWSTDRRTAYIVRDGQPTAEVSLSAAAAIAESFGLEVPSTRGNLHRAY